MPLLAALASSSLAQAFQSQLLMAQFLLAEPDHFSLIEKLLLVALIAVSAALFWKRFGVVVDKILKSRKDPGFHLFPIGKRIWDFFWEVLCQAKVIRERPLPGLAHAFVFWSFLAFALVTLNHVATGFGIGFLNPAGLFGRSISGSPPSLPCLRRLDRRPICPPFFCAPVWLARPALPGHEVSWESGVIAGLIFALMATYLASFFVTDASLAARMLWWAHTFSLLSFLPLVPHTKHLHLILSPVTIFLSRGGFSRYSAALRR
jgi:hypothetical protein